MQVSVIIPVYNAALFLDKSIKSALDESQTGEVILIDDRSTDGSWEMCEAWVMKDKRVRLYRNEGIKGAGAARNVGLSQVACEYVAFLDADDYYLEGRFDEDEVIFQHNKNLLATANKVEIITPEKKDIKGLNAIFRQNDKIAFQKSFSLVNVYDFFKGSALHLNGLTYKSNLAIRFDENLKQAQDIDFILRLILISTIMSTNMDKTKAVYNIHDSNTISQISEAIYYRRKAAKKLLHLAWANNLSYSLIWKFFKDFVEYDYLWYFGKNHINKKGIKLFLIPFFMFRIFSKTDPEYDKNRTIHLA